MKWVRISSIFTRPLPAAMLPVGVVIGGVVGGLLQGGDRGIYGIPFVVVGGVWYIAERRRPEKAAKQVEADRG